MAQDYKFIILLLLLVGSACGKTPVSTPSQPSPAPKPINTPEDSRPVEPPEPMPQPAHVARDKYLRVIIGMPENTLIQAFNDPNSPVPTTLATRDAKGFFTITNAENNQRFKAGKFEHDKTVKALIDQSSKLPTPGLGTFNIVDGSAFPHKVKEVDVAWLQAQSENRQAVFQVASNQNGLEQVDATTSVEAQRLEDYPFDNTQGPIASISAAPGLLVRWGYAYFDPNTKPSTWRQRDAHQINLLEHLPALPVNQAGYVIWDKTPTVLPANDDYQKIKIGYHEDIQVTFGRSDGQSYPFLIEPEQTIDQVFCAAVALNYQHGAEVDIKSPAVVAWSQMVLKGIYEGTIRYSHLKGRTKLFLTSVGGGVFGNAPKWIDDAIMSMKDYIVASGLNVIFVNYKDPISAQLMQMVSDTNGCYRQYDAQGQVIKSFGICK